MTSVMRASTCSIPAPSPGLRNDDCMISTRSSRRPAWPCTRSGAHPPPPPRRHPTPLRTPHRPGPVPDARLVGCVALANRPATFRRPTAPATVHHAVRTHQEGFCPRDVAECCPSASSSHRPQSAMPTTRKVRIPPDITHMETPCPGGRGGPLVDIGMPSAASAPCRVGEALQRRSAGPSLSRCVQGGWGVSGAGVASVTAPDCWEGLAWMPRVWNAKNAQDAPPPERGVAPRTDSARHVGGVAKWLGGIAFHPVPTGGARLL